MRNHKKARDKALIIIAVVFVCYLFFSDIFNSARSMVSYWPNDLKGSMSYIDNEGIVVREQKICCEINFKSTDISKYFGFDREKKLAYLKKDDLSNDDTSTSIIKLDINNGVQSSIAITREIIECKSIIYAKGSIYGIRVSGKAVYLISLNLITHKINKIKLETELPPNNDIKLQNISDTGVLVQNKREIKYYSFNDRKWKSMGNGCNSKLSPDGKYIAYSPNNDSEMNIIVLEIATGRQQQFNIWRPKNIFDYKLVPFLPSSHPESLRQFCWSADSRYVICELEQWEITMSYLFAVDIKTGHITKLPALTSRGYLCVDY